MSRLVKGCLLYTSDAADGYTRRNSRWSRLWRHIPAPAYVAAGALGATVCWCVALVL